MWQGLKVGSKFYISKGSLQSNSVFSLHSIFLALYSLCPSSFLFCILFALHHSSVFSLPSIFLAQKKQRKVATIVGQRKGKESLSYFSPQIESTLNGESGIRFPESIQYSLCPVTQNRKDYEGERDKACKTAMHFLESILHHKYITIFSSFSLSLTLT